MEILPRRAARAIRLVARTSLRASCGFYPGWYNGRDARCLQRQRRNGAVHEPDLRGVAHLVPGDALVLDVGANYGQSVVSFKALLPQARIHSFEPNPSSFEELGRLASAYDDVEVHQVAVGAEHARIELSVPVVRGVVFHQLASVRPMSTSDLIRQLHTDGFRWARARDVEWRCTSIEVVTLDSFGFTPALVKIDVEGGEPGVLDGARATLRALPVIVVERGLRPEVRSRLEPLGYRALEWRQGQLEPAVGATLNTYFVGNGAFPSSV